MNGSTGTPATKHKFLLFVAGNEAKSVQARDNLHRICEEHLPGRYEVREIDVFQDFRVALEENILLTPAVKRVEPPPPVTLFGTLADRERVLPALRLGGNT